MSTSSLPILLRSLRLPTIAREYDQALHRAEAENWGYKRFLSYLFEAEGNDRLQRKIQRQLKDSNLPAGKTLEALDLKLLPEKVRRQIPALLEADFVRRGDNLLCFGLAGRGKSHFVNAIAREWICRHQLQVLFIPAFRLVTQLLAAKRDLKLPQAINRLQRFDAVIVDDIGYVQQSREEMEVLFHFLAERYEKKSVVITSNLVFSQWDQIFKDPMTTMAAIDRLVHHATILDFTGSSVRADEAKKRQN
ncbi:IS21-like element helper ATPase IstB [Polaromonas sp.]|uniref:IS21-like element helper ATPase IstB n=1 Tax=Polaromonas sp. TaxID=1869339 RepID=UPI0024890816|nr:IS21-like element helper ATPase IstB [Polaromonas sp.]MDI1273575.1 IS21-like element helper ATPase IstB [Polaromonas sp.]